MIQWILTVFIVLAAVIYAGHLVYKKFFKKPEPKNADCHSCTTDCNNCPMTRQTLPKDFPNR